MLSEHYFPIIEKCPTPDMIEVLYFPRKCVHYYILLFTVTAVTAVHNFSPLFPSAQYPPLPRQSPHCCTCHGCCICIL